MTTQQFWKFMGLAPEFTVTTSRDHLLRVGYTVGISSSSGKKHQACKIVAIKATELLLREATWWDRILDFFHWIRFTWRWSQRMARYF